MSLAPLILGVARAVRRGGGGAWRPAVAATNHLAWRTEQKQPSFSTKPEIAAEASLYETGDLNPRDFGYAHPRLAIEQDKTNDGRGRRVVVVGEESGGGGERVGGSSDIALGSTLLLARPLAFLDAPEEHQPRPEQIVDVIAMRRLWQTPAAAALQWEAAPPSFAASRGAPPPPPPRPPPPPLLELATLPRDFTQPAPLDDRAANQAEPDAAATSLVAINAFGDEYEDLPAATLRSKRNRPPAADTPSGIIASAAAAAGAPGATDPHHGGPRAVAGVWPAFALLNHSCAPNATHYVCGSTMVVRATADLGPGTEVQVSYLGREAFAPADDRRRALRERYGFRCECARCRAEDELPTEVKERASAARSAVVARLRPRFEAAVREGDGAEAAAVAGEVSALLRGLEEALEKAAAVGGGGSGGGDGDSGGGSAATAQAADGALAAQAVAYEAYELAYFASALAEASLGAGLEEQAEGQDEDDSDDEAPRSPPQLAHGETPEDRQRRARAWRGARQAATAALSRCVLVLDGVARGSEVHVLSAHALLRRAAMAAKAAAAKEKKKQQQEGGGGGKAQAAARMAEAAAAVVSAAHHARYGASNLPESVALGLLEASRELSDAYF
jgi:hypothetical protein